MPHFGAGVIPSMNPSRVQLRRCAIHGYAHHTYPEVLIEHLLCIQFCSSNHSSNKQQATAYKFLKIFLLLIKNTPTPSIVNKHRVGAVTSEAMDGVAPDLSPGWARGGKNSSNAVRHTPRYFDFDFDFDFDSISLAQ